MNHTTTARIGRRAFLANGSLVLAAGLDPTFGTSLLAADAPKTGVRVGLVTDLHYADKKPAGTRHYRETLDKLAEAAERFKKENTDFVVELGDLIDAADSVETELKYLKRIDKEFSTLLKDRHHVLGRFSCRLHFSKCPISLSSSGSPAWWNRRTTFPSWSIRSTIGTAVMP